MSFLGLFWPHSAAARQPRLGAHRAFPSFGPVQAPLRGAAAFASEDSYAEWSRTPLESLLASAVDTGGACQRPRGDGDAGSRSAARRVPPAARTFHGVRPRFPTCTLPPPARLGPRVPVLSPHGPGGHTPSPGCRVPRDGALMSTVALRLRGGGGDHKSIWSIF